MMAINWPEWMTLRQAYLHAWHALSNSKTAKNAIRYHLERSDIKAIFSSMIETTGDGSTNEKRWGVIPSEFWLGSGIDWDHDFAELPVQKRLPDFTLPAERARFSRSSSYAVSGIFLRRSDVSDLWPAGSAEPSDGGKKPRSIDARWSAAIEQDLQNRAVRLADGSRSAEEVWKLLNHEVHPRLHIGRTKFYKLIWRAVPLEKKLSAGDNATTLAAKARRPSKP